MLKQGVCHCCRPLRGRAAARSSCGENCPEACQIAAFCQRTGMAESAFGRCVLYSFRGLERARAGIDAATQRRFALDGEEDFVVDER